MLFLELHRASFRGVNFLMDSSETEMGRKTVTHEYPNKKDRFVEDLGQNLRTFKIKAIISEPLYKVKKRRLENALNAKGAGVLRHPLYGNVDVVVTKFTITEDMVALGEGKLEITFEEANLNILPKSTGNIISDALNAIDELQEKIEEFIADNFVTNFSQNIADAADVLNEMLATLEEIKDPINSADNQINEFSGQVQRFKDNMFSLIQNPVDLASQTMSTLGSFNDVGSAESEKLGANNSLFGFGDTQVDFPLNTFQRIERQKNRDVINNATNATALTNGYAAAIQDTYSNDQDMADTFNTLESNYQVFIEDNLFTNDMISDLQQIRDDVRTFFDEENLNVDRIISIETKSIPVTILAYNYYSKLDRRDEIISLNDVFDPSAVSGEISILEVQAEA